MRILCAVVSLLAGASAFAQTPCAAPPARRAASLFLETASARPADSVLIIRLCLANAKSLGSYMAVVSFDSTKLRPISVVTRGGVQAANATVSGEVRVAGAAPSGFANGELVLMRFKQVSGANARLTLVASEASSTTGTSILGEMVVSGWPRRPVTRLAPVIDSILPRAGELDHDRVTDMTIFGKGFAATGNDVVFGLARIPGLMSEGSGTIIRFPAPSLRLNEGPIAIRVRHDGLQSNAVTFTVRDGKR